MRARRAVVLGSLLAIGCGGGVEVDSSGGGGSGASGAVSTSSGTSTAGIPLSCKEEQICPPVAIDEPCSYCSSLGCTDDGSEPSADDTAVRCTLEALRDRRPGRVLVNRDPDNFGFCGDTDELTIIEDGTAWRHSTHYLDLIHDESSFAVTLAPPAYFQQCLDGGPAAALACLRSEDLYDWMEPAQCACPFCVEDPGF